MTEVLDGLRALYFTHRGAVRRLTEGEKGKVPDGDALAKLSEAGYELARIAQHLRHYLPERADEKLEESKRGARHGVHGNQPARYVIVWPDGELYASPYVQKPAAVRKFEQATRNWPNLRLWDDRAGKFILG